MHTTSPVSFPVSINRLPAKGMPVTIEADVEQRAALAEAQGLVSVDRFRVEVLVTDWKGDGVAVRGRVEAEIVQSCIVSLEPVPAHIEEPIDSVFLPTSSKLMRFGDPSGEVLVDPEGPDAPEPLEGDHLDIGALAEEYFAVAIDPYPRRAGAEPLRNPDQDDAPKGQLAEKLAALKNKL